MLVTAADGVIIIFFIFFHISLLLYYLYVLCHYLGIIIIEINVKHVISFYNILLYILLSTNYICNYYCMHNINAI